MVERVHHRHTVDAGSHASSPPFVVAALQAASTFDDRHAINRAGQAAVLHGREPFTASTRWPHPVASPSSVEHVASECYCAHAVCSQVPLASIAGGNKAPLLGERGDTRCGDGRPMDEQVGHVIDAMHAMDGVEAVASNVLYAKAVACAQKVFE